MRIHSDIFEAISKLTPGPYQNQIPGAIPQYGIGEAAGPPWQPKAAYRAGRSRFCRIERRERQRGIKAAHENVLLRMCCVHMDVRIRNWNTMVFIVRWRLKW